MAGWSHTCRLVSSRDSGTCGGMRVIQAAGLDRAQPPSDCGPNDTFMSPFIAVSKPRQTLIKALEFWEVLCVNSSLHARGRGETEPGQEAARAPRSPHLAEALSSS